MSSANTQDDAGPSEVRTEIPSTADAATAGTNQETEIPESPGHTLLETICELSHLNQKMTALEQLLHPATTEGGVTRDLVSTAAHVSAVKRGIQVMSRKGKTLILLRSDMFPDSNNAESMQKILAKSIEDADIENLKNLAQDLVKNRGRTQWLTDWVATLAGELSKNILRQCKEIKALSTPSAGSLVHKMSQLFDLIPPDAVAALPSTNRIRPDKRVWDANSGTDEVIPMNTSIQYATLPLHTMESLCKARNNQRDVLNRRLENLNMPMNNVTNAAGLLASEQRTWRQMKTKFEADWSEREAPALSDPKLIEQLQKAAEADKENIEDSLTEFLCERRTEHLKAQGLDFVLNPFVTDKVHNLTTLPNGDANQVYARRSDIMVRWYHPSTRASFHDILKTQIEDTAPLFGIQLPTPSGDDSQVSQ